MKDQIKADQLVHAMHVDNPVFWEICLKFCRTHVVWAEISFSFSFQHMRQYFVHTHNIDIILVWMCTVVAVSIQMSM